MRGYRQFSFWIPILLFKQSHKPHTNKRERKTSVLVGTVLKNLFKDVLSRVMTLRKKKKLARAIEIQKENWVIKFNLDKKNLKRCCV